MDSQDTSVKRVYERSPNFNAVEKSVLVDLVEIHKDIIENKRTDAVYAKKKEEEWAKIAEEFNAQSAILRNAKQLKTCYENIKYRARKHIAEDKVCT